MARQTSALLAWLLLLPVGTAATGEQPLRELIDGRIEDANLGLLAPIADDGEFLRRVYLDLAGCVPPIDVAREFLDDTSTDKRARVVDSLLGSPGYVRHMTDTIDLMLMERRGEKHIKREEWRAYLRDSVAANKPWDQLAREILAADGTDEKIRAAAAFYLFREGETNLLTRDVGRIFFGMDLQCAQCHDHPLISTYYQADYYGIYAFLNRGFLFTDADKKVFFAEKAEGDVSFKSVFTGEQGQTTPRLPTGFEIHEPFFLKGEEYEVAPADKVRPIPKYSRRSQLAALATEGSNRPFVRNIVNRLWAHMFGRGLVEPVDLHHDGNAASHPELIELLGDRFVAMDFNIQAFLRELALTRTYQRALEVPGSFADQAEELQSQLTRMEAEQSRIEEALGEARSALSRVESQLSERATATASVQAELAKQNQAVGEARKAADAATKALAESTRQRDEKRALAEAISAAAAATNSAAEALPNQKDLLEIATKLKARALVSAKELESAEKSLNGKASAAENANKALADARQIVDSSLAKLAAARQLVAELQPRVIEARQKQDDLRRSREGMKSRLEVSRLVLEHQQFETRFQDAVASREKATAELTRHKDAFSTATRELDRLRAESEKRGREMQRMSEQLEDARLQLTRSQEVASLLSIVSENTQTAAATLPQDVELTDMTRIFQDHEKRLQTECEDLAVATTRLTQVVESEAEILARTKRSTEKRMDEVARLEQAVSRLEGEMREFQSRQHSARTELDARDQQLTQAWSIRFGANRLTPLTPEQMAWSVMQATGMLAATRESGLAEVDKELPLDPANPEDPERLAARSQRLDAFIQEKVRGHVATFVKLFGHGAGQPQADFFATVDQSLFFTNGSTLHSWLTPRGHGLLARLNQLQDPQAIAEELYLSILTRRPDSTESADVAAYLADRNDDRDSALQDLAWALITSAEFRFDH